MLYNTGNSISCINTHTCMNTQYLVIIYNGRESEKEHMYN